MPSPEIAGSRRTENQPVRPARVIRVALRLIAVVALVFGLDALVFRTNLYPPITDPDSAAGNVESLIWNEMHRKMTGRNQVLAVGNSRMQLLPRIANGLAGTTGYGFGTLAIGGCSMRGWYYMLRDVDPTARRYAAILVPVEDYDDQDHVVDQADWILDLYYMIGRFRLTDLFDFSSTFHRRDYQWEAFRGLLLKGSVYKQDFQHFLKNPEKRLKFVELVRRESRHWVFNYVGPKHSLAGLTIDWKTRTAQYPPGLPESTRKMIRDELLAPPPPHTGLMGVYQREWFGRLRERYRGSGTKLIVIRLTRGPILKPEPVPFRPHSSVRELASQPEFVLLNEHLLDELERPDLFVDAVHLNAEGANRFSQIVAREVGKVLGPPSGAYALNKKP